MKRGRIQRTIACCLVATTLLTAPVLSPRSAAAGSIADSKLYTTASTWAKPEIEKAYVNSLIPERLLSKNAPQPATREELCELAIALYEKVTDTEVQPVSPNPFHDTENEEILKAYRLGITTGTSATTFSPDSSTNREQVATMFGRTIRLMFPDGDYSLEGAPTFSDQAEISTWALDHVKVMSKAGILKGSEGKFMPRPLTEAQEVSGYGTTKREEAVAISIRIYEQYTNPAVSEQESFVRSLIEVSTPPMRELEKLAKIDFDSRFFRPVYCPKVTLSAQTGFDPDGECIYSDCPYAALVRSDGDQLANFTVALSDDVRGKVSKIVWQVSLIPFVGAPVTMSTPAPGGLLMSGSLPATATAFSVDFAEVIQADTALRNPKAGGALKPAITPGLITWLPVSTGLVQTLQKNAPLPTEQRTYYVRAYPVDALGRSIGDTGAGLPVLYGDPVPAKDGKLTIYTKPFSLKLANQAGTVDYRSEFPNNFGMNRVESRMTTNQSKLYSILPAGFPADTEELLVQVSVVKFAGQANDSWLSVPGLVYEKSVYPDDAEFVGLKSQTPQGIAIDFSKLLPAENLLPAEDIPYYIRVVALTKGAKAGTVNARYSETVLVRYGKPAEPPKILDLKPVYITPNIPVVASVSYTPIQWEREGWQYHYVVTRQPTYNDIFSSGPFSSGIKVQNGNELYPLYPVGTKLDFTPPPPAEKSWYEKAKDAVVGFFEDMVNVVAGVVNWVSKTYNGLKAGLIKFAVSALPLPDFLEGPMATALTALVDYGLWSIGIPPTLPNFDELAEQGVSYLATVAMEQAQVPAGDLVKYGVDQLADGLKDNLKSSTSGVATPNPMNWNFIKYDPEYLYKPAYILIDIYNPSNTETTPAGVLSCDVMARLDMSKLSSSKSVSSLYNAYGSQVIKLFKPVRGMEIPQLAPGQKMTVPLFLEEYVGLPFYEGMPPVEGWAYATMYALGEYEFSLHIQYDLPSPVEEAKRQGLSAEGIYQYSMAGNDINFTTLPTQSYSK